MRRTLPVIAAILCGAALLADLLLDVPVVNAIGSTLLEGIMILGAFALILAVLKLVTYHVGCLVHRESGAGGSVVLLAGLLAALGLGLARPTGTELQWLFDYVYEPLQATMAALLAFFGIQGAYRAFRLRSGEAAVLLVSALFALLAQLPIASAISPVLPRLRQWMVTVPAAAGMRGILLGVSLGAIIASLRILFGVERPYT
ncbi:MAG: hypothetical protein ACP5G7_01515 [Anaerolineae bacterium]